MSSDDTLSAEACRALLVDKTNLSPQDRRVLGFLWMHAKGSELEKALAGLAFGQKANEDEASALALALKSSDSDLRLAAIRRIEQTGIWAVHSRKQFPAALKSTAPLLCDALRDQSESVRKTAASTLSLMAPFEQHLGETAIQCLTRALEDESQQVRKEVATALGLLKCQSQSAVPALCRALRDDVALVRTAAAFALAEIPCAREDTIRSLAEALSDEYFAVRRGAANALARRGCAAQCAIPSLIKALRTKQDSEHAEIANALRAIDPNAAKEAGL